jgi:signal peptidase I
MAKRKLPESKNRRGPSQLARAESDTKNEDAWFSPAAIRETVESVIVAFVLAFLFRTFEAEAFVIPTGSMAPTLMGKHKDLECPMCHYRYPVSASDNQESNKPAIVDETTCPMCRYSLNLSASPDSYPSYDGDRILVAKFPYEFADPKRWDVIVFKYPGNAMMNYIKRLVGKPGETIRIRDGNLWIKPDKPDGRFEIARKPPEKILAMLQLVYDNDLAPTISGELHWPARWTSESGGRNNGWDNSKGLASFEIEDGAKGEAWIRYHHRVPTYQQWNPIGRPGMSRQQWIDMLKAGTITERVSEQLISDFTAYNTGISDQRQNVSPNMIRQGFGQHWVGDLAVQFEVDSKSATGTLVAELIRGGCQFQCRFDLAGGKAELSIHREGLEADPEADRVAGSFHPTALTPTMGKGRHSITFSNVDDELRVWVDGAVVPFDNSTAYDSAHLNTRIPTVADLSPVGIASEGASLKVSHIKVLRDVYYIAVNNKGLQPDQSSLQDFKSLPNLANPEHWASSFAESNFWPCDDIVLKPHDPANPEKDQFFVLGDNSAQSADGRLWMKEQWVERELLIGKALFIYWPHGWKIPYVPLPFNIVPYFQRMHLVR